MKRRTMLLLGSAALLGGGVLITTSQLRDSGMPSVVASEVGTDHAVGDSDVPPRLESELIPSRSAASGSGPTAPRPAQAPVLALDSKLNQHSTTTREHGVRPRDGYFQRKGPGGRIVEEGLYKHGEKEGPWVDSSDSGTKLLEGSYLHGRATGFWRGWYESGQLRVEGQCNNGRFEGPIRFWKENGEIDAERSGEYSDGEWIHH